MFIYLFITIFALLIGSFLNVLIYRLPRGESVVWPGSHCTACGHRLGAGDLLPVFSYIWLRGKCRYCGEKINLRYPLVEILTAFLFILIYSKWGLSVQTLSGCIFSAILLAAAFTDINEGIIPDRLNYPGIILGLFLSLFTIGLKSALIGTIVFAGILFLIALISRGGMGGGDIKMAGLIGAFTGWKGALMVLLISSLLGGVWAVFLLLSGKAGRGAAIKFGPFLALSAWLVWMYNQQIITFYWQLLQ